MHGKGEKIEVDPMMSSTNKQAPSNHQKVQLYIVNVECGLNLRTSTYILVLFNNIIYNISNYCIFSPHNITIVL